MYQECTTNTVLSPFVVKVKFMSEACPANHVSSKTSVNFQDITQKKVNKSKKLIDDLDHLTYI